MNYNVTDNREIIGDYFIEQSDKGDIYVYKRGTMEHIETIKHNRVFTEKEFKKICKDYVGV